MSVYTLRFTLKATSKLTCVSVQTIERWLKEFAGLFNPPRDSEGRPRFGKEEMSTLLTIKYFLRQKKLSVADTKTELERRASLQTVRQNVSEAAAALKRINVLFADSLAILHDNARRFPKDSSEECDLAERIRHAHDKVNVIQANLF